MIVAFRLTVPAAEEDQATALLWSHGTTGVEVRSARGGRVALVGYFERRAGLERALRTDVAALDRYRLQRVAVPDVDWVARFREGFRRFRVGPFSFAPPWDEGRSRGTIWIDPGRAFGTGTHESTRLCLLAIAELAGRGPLGRVADVGCGTGILAIAAARSGAARVVAVDVDGEAVVAAAHHAQLNTVDLALVRGDGGRPLRTGSFDLVVANVAAPFLLERAEELSALRSSSGALVLAGFLEEDLSALRRRYRPLGSAEERRQGGWALLIVGLAGS